ncbi:MAG: YvcK family protein [Eggerthellaceae bacterium]|nr:YvcK family protein [Eggerthellaceae bacterium]
MHRPFKSDPSSTEAFQVIRDEEPVVGSTEAPRAVVIGGETGAPSSIHTLLSMGLETSAVVSMADDGGSTGILRERAHVLPPGDIRKCLVAMASDSNDPYVRAFKYRFDFANNHTLGNLTLSALEDATGSFPEAIRICERMLGARGHVHPSTLANIVLCGRTQDGHTIEGQSQLSHSDTALSEVWLKDPDAEPYPGAIKAICEADLIVLGPGSLFTSIIPNLLVPGVVDAIRSSKGRTLFVCSLADMQGETWGLSVEEHIDALLSHGLEGLLDYALVHTPKPLRPGGTEPGNFEALSVGATSATESTEVSPGPSGIRPVVISYDAAHRIQEKGPMVIARNLVDPKRPTWHDPFALREAFTGVLKACRSPQM